MGARLVEQVRKWICEEIWMKMEVLKSRRMDASARESKKYVRNLENQWNMLQSKNLSINQRCNRKNVWTKHKGL